MIYKVFITRKAQKQLAKLPAKELQALATKIENLANDPVPSGAKKMKGYDNTYRIRQGIYRAIYEVINDTLTITVFKVGKRKDIYE